MVISFVLVADYRKKSATLGTNVRFLSFLLKLTYLIGLSPGQWKQGVPIEVVPFAYTKVLQNLEALKSPAILRMAKAKAGPVVSDNGNFIIDAPFDEEKMAHPYEVCLPTLM